MSQYKRIRRKVDPEEKIEIVEEKSKPEKKAKGSITPETGKVYIFNDEWYENYRKNTLSENYKGVETPKECHRNSERNELTRYSEYTALKNMYGKKIKGPSGKGRIIDFLHKVGFSDKKKQEKLTLDLGFEGSSIESTLKHHREICEENNVRTILEVGFNSGISSENFASIKKDGEEQIEQITSVDIGTHLYVPYAKLAIDKLYPGKHLLLIGDSKDVLPNFHKTFPDKKYDLIFIDGDHTFCGAYLDILNCKDFAHEDTILVIDNVAPHRGVGIEVYQAFIKHIDENNLIFISHHKIKTHKNDYWDGYVVCKYNLTGEEVENDIPYLDIESMIPSRYYAEKLEKVKDKSERRRIIEQIESEDILKDEYLLREMAK